MEPEILAIAPRCGARTRAGRPCRAPAVHGHRRCRMHGGKGSGARRGNLHGWKHGTRSAWIRQVVHYLRATSPNAPLRMTPDTPAPTPPKDPFAREKIKIRTSNPMHPGNMRTTRNWKLAAARRAMAAWKGGGGCPPRARPTPAPPACGRGEEAG
ncbi:HGGxSTG domain-containing protein [Rhizorhabdus dicambivorans]|uniref:Uncharacterized protein n=1 Tax=Rhizorhabdus dicambivorans TaxID=1850238 RepID=A0A2A4FV32_9SPHN|nr:HGGxSTG domain-containing protein [Rhizorhabdus dicambivorans]ATE64085.1 hypothetical protein CMV14_06515 [Rhizorhabdus dicambivorans]PCE42641.1 hypothetical protein COO09_09560 [Rhizorhabdus dicambivorans]